MYFQDGYLLTIIITIIIIVTITIIVIIFVIQVGKLLTMTHKTQYYNK